MGNFSNTVQVRSIAATDHRGRSWLLSAKTIASGVDEREIRKVHRVSPLAFSREQSAGQMQTIGSIEGQARVRTFLATSREKGVIVLPLPGYVRPQRLYEDADSQARLRQELEPHASQA